MITPTDRHTLAAMVGTAMVEAGQWPKGFEDEYAIRVGMLARCGATQTGLGPFALVGLLRTFNVGHATIKDQDLSVHNWRDVEHGTIIMNEGRRGAFRGIAGEGCIYIKLDGYKALHEVAESSCTLGKSKIDGIKDKDLATEPMSAAQEVLVRDEKDQFDEDWVRWNNVDPGTEVEFLDHGKVATGMFMDIDRNNKIKLEVNDEIRTLEPNICTVPELAEA